MENRAFSKKLMLVAGILAAVVILFSQTFQKETSSFLSKIKVHKTENTEKAADAEKKVIIAAPADAVTSSQAVEVEDADATLIREIIFGQKSESKKSWVDKDIVSNLFKTLFRVFISPQAP